MKATYPLLIAIATLMTATPIATAAPGDECVKLVGVSSSGERLSMDPSVNTSSEDLLYLASIYEPLVQLDPSFQPVPALAESWQPSTDAKQWTFKLRRGVKFHHGREFDAEDVVHTFKRLLNPARASGARAVLAFIDPEGIEAVDSHTVRYTLKQPVAEFPILFSTKYSLIVPRDVSDASLAQRGVGTGPFLQESFKKGAPFNLLVRNPTYWRPGLPKAACHRISVITEPVTRVAALLSGDADVVTLLDGPAAATLRNNPKVKILKTAGATAMTLAMWVDKPPFDDVRVRTALKLVVDRQAIVDTALLGFGEVGNDNPVPPSSPVAFAREVRKRDVARAKQLLAEAGHASGLQIDLYTSTVPAGALNIAQAYVQMAAEAGIRVNLITTPGATFYSETWLKVPFKTSGWAARSPAQALAAPYRKTTNTPDTRWFRDDYDALLDRANASVDPEQRATILKEAQRMLHDEGGVIIPAFASVVSAVRAECTGYEPHPSLNVYDFASIECKK